MRKAPASTVETLARAVASLLGEDDPEIRVIGTRHGEKLHETLLSREEMLKAADQGDYFRVPLDARSLEYELYYEQGEPDAAQADEYTSANTVQLDLEATEEAAARSCPRSRPSWGGIAVRVVADRRRRVPRLAHPRPAPCPDRPRGGARAGVATGPSSRAWSRTQTQWSIWRE